MVFCCWIVIVPKGFAAETAITTTSSYEYFPEISGDKIVWSEDRYSLWSLGYGKADIYMYDLSNNTKFQITTNENNQEFPAIDGDKIVWSDNRNGNWDIYMYDLGTKMEMQITNDSNGQMFPRIHGDKIVWMDDRNGNSDIYMYEISTKTESQITTNSSEQRNPDIDGEKIVWVDDRNGIDWNIFMYDINSTTNPERQITTNSSQQRFPRIDGDKIVWDDNRNGNYDIYMYDLSTNTEKLITSDGEYQIHPVIDGNRIVWEDNRNGNWDIYMYNLYTNKESQITINNYGQGRPVVDDNKIVWQDKRNGNEDIYLFEDNEFFYIKNFYYIYNKFLFPIWYVEKDFFILAESNFLESVDHNEIQYVTNSDISELIEIYQKNMEEAGIEIIEKSSTSLVGVTKDGDSTSLAVTESDEYEGYSHLVKVEYTNNLSLFLEKFPIPILVKEQDFIVLNETTSLDNVDYNEIQYATNTDIRELMEIYQKNMEEAGIEIT